MQLGGNSKFDVSRLRLSGAREISSMPMAYFEKISILFD